MPIYVFDDGYGYEYYFIDKNKKEAQKSNPGFGLIGQLTHDIKVIEVLTPKEVLKKHPYKTRISLSGDVTLHE